MPENINISEEQFRIFEILKSTEDDLIAKLLFDEGLATRDSFEEFMDATGLYDDIHAVRILNDLKLLEILQKEGRIVEKIKAPNTFGNITGQNNKPLFILPINNPGLWEFYKRCEASFWTAEEIDFSDDKQHFDKLNTGERHFILNILASALNTSVEISDSLTLKLIPEVRLAEARCFYSFQLMMEQIHSETISIGIEYYLKSPLEVANMMDPLNSFPSVARKIMWISDKVRDESFMQRLLAFITSKGILCAGSICAIFWLKKRGLMPGLTFSNELISRDYTLHCEFASALYNMLDNKLSQEQMADVFGQAVTLEKEFMSEALPVNLIGMTAQLMHQYIEFVADSWLNVLGYSRIFQTKNPFDFMDWNFGFKKTNFFEKRISEETDYGKVSAVAAKAIHRDTHLDY